MIIHDASGQPYDADLVPGPQYRELAEALSRMLDVYAPYHTGLCGIVLPDGSTSPCHCTSAARQARVALAHHRAKQ